MEKWSCFFFQVMICDEEDDDDDDDDVNGWLWFGFPDADPRTSPSLYGTSIV